MAQHSTSAGAPSGKIDLIDTLAAKRKTKGGDSTLGKDAFLQLLVAQLANQDPMKPMEDTAFIAEMANFSSLEQMQNMNKLLEKQQLFGQLSQASSMIGKHVEVADPEKGSVRGKVTEVRQFDGGMHVVIDGNAYDATLVRKVADAPITGVQIING